MAAPGNVSEKTRALEQQISATRVRLAQLTRELEEAESLVGTELKDLKANHLPALKPVEYRSESSVLIVGVGGLGCPAAAYLAGAGVGCIGLIDGDVVELSNLHRQILHSTETIGISKVESAMIYLQRLNPLVQYKSHGERLTPGNALKILDGYDVILDCTDNPATRYLISDTAIILQKPLISGSALRMEGQLMVLNSPPRPPGDPIGGPCYRCVFPKPPPAENVLSCGDGGILGPVVGIIGVLQALEAIKLITADPVKDDTQAEKPSLLLFSAFSNPQFRAIRLRPRRAKCAACSAQATVTRDSMDSGSLDYVQFCGISSPVNVLSNEERVSAQAYKERHGGVNQDHLLLDVREEVQFKLVSLDGSMNIPFSHIQSGIPRDPDRWTTFLQSQEHHAQSLGGLPSPLPPDAPIFVVCRYGNDSQLAVRKLKDAGLDQG
ncbi:MAG: Urmylation protein, partial [Candelina submexicana]